MKADKLEKIERVKAFLEKEGIFYTEKANGHLQVGKANLWATTEKWQHGDERGTSVTSFVAHVKGVTM